MRQRSTMSMILRHTDRGVWSADASDLGLPPGRWPREITAACGDETIRARLLTLHSDSAGDTTHAEYVPFGRRFRILIWND